MGNEIIIAQNLAIKLANKEDILNAANFAIRRGECCALIGANGVGKTTLLRAILGLVPICAGHLTMCDLKFDKLGFAPDTPPLYPYDTVKSYLTFIAKLKGLKKPQLTANIENCLNIFELQHFANKLIYTLSKGTAQRLNLAQACLNNPELLILDEPTNALDQDQNQNFCNFIKLLKRQGTTIIVATHQYQDIIPLCDYMLKIQNKRIKKLPTPIHNQDIKETYDHLHYTT